MKKILATLLVATMLLSCMSVLTYAATSVYLQDVVWDVTKSKGQIKDAATRNYVNAITDYVSDEEWETLYEGSPLYAALSDTDADAVAALPTPYVYTSNEYVMVPVYGEELSVVMATVSYDEKYFERVYDLKAGFVGNVADKDGYYFNIATGGDGDQTGFVGGVFLKVKDLSVVEGDENGNAVTNITLNVQKATNGDEVLGTSGNVTMTVNLKGLKATTVTKENATVEDLAPAYSVDAVGGADDYAAIVEKGVEIKNAGVAYDYATYGNYRIFFGKFVADTFNQPTAQGFIIKGGKEDVKATALTEFKAGAPFGILVFGMGGQTELTAEPFIEY